MLGRSGLRTRVPALNSWSQREAGRAMRPRRGSSSRRIPRHDVDVAGAAAAAEASIAIYATTVCDRRLPILCDSGRNPAWSVWPRLLLRAARSLLLRERRIATCSGHCLERLNFVDNSVERVSADASVGDDASTLCWAAATSRGAWLETVKSRTDNLHCMSRRAPPPPRFTNVSFQPGKHREDAPRRQVARNMNLRSQKYCPDSTACRSRA